MAHDIMRTPRLKFIVISLLALGLALVVWGLIDARPPVSLTVISMTTNHWPEDIAARFGRRTYVCAVVAVTNNTGRPFTYWTRYSEDSVEYRVLHQTPLGWKEPASRWRCGTGLQKHTLSPLRGFTFQAVVETDKPFKVALDYWDGHKPSSFWRWLPSWLSQRLPWSSPWHTATTDVIDLREPRA